MRQKEQHLIRRLCVRTGLALLGALAFCVPHAFAQVCAVSDAVSGTGSAPASVAMGDFNGDGILDMAVANSGDNTVSIMLGKADGSYTTAAVYPTGTTPSGVTAADFNGDGKLDLVVANKGNDSISVLLGNGNGTFKTPVSYGTAGFVGNSLPVLPAVTNLAP